jgi:LmbE family N-acetylglucosaminyl deacetylase
LVRNSLTEPAGWRTVCLWIISTLFLAGVLISVWNFQGSSPAWKQVVVLQVPDPSQRLLIISPHPDDESLGAGGLIAQAVSRGDAVKVAFVTNGDGFSLGADRYYHHLYASKKDALNYGKQRQQEALAATAALGVSPNNVLLLGFPDHGLYPIWKSYWNPGQAYRSRSTNQTRVAYQLAVTPGEPYTAPALLNTLETIMKEYRPTDIYVTDTSDIHPDHLATGAFTLAAVAELESEDPSFQPAVYTFVIHSSTWQLLPSLEPDQVYLPPGYFLDQGSGWYRLPLTSAVLATKEAAIAAYRTQKLVIAPFMKRFEGPDELFCLQRQRQLASLAPSVVGSDGPLIWPTGARISFNPDASPDRLKNNDLRAAFLARSGDNIWLRLNMLGRAGIDAHYVVSVYLLSNQNSEPVIRRFSMQITPGKKRIDWLAKPAGYDSSGVSFSYANHQIDLIIPGALMASDSYLMFNDDTTIGRIPVAQVPWCLLKI